VALVVSFGDLLKGVSQPTDIIQAIKDSGLLLTVFVGREEAKKHGEALRVLKDAGVVLGLQTWAGGKSR